MTAADRRPEPSTAPPLRDGHVEGAAETPCILLERHIALRTGRRLRDLRITANNGQLSVCARVTSYHLKQLVIAAAMAFLAETGIVAEVAIEVAEQT